MQRESDVSGVKILFIPLSTVCVNSCEGCIYTQEQRTNKDLLPLEDFKKYVNKFNDYCKKVGFNSHFIFGTGEVLAYNVTPYVEYIYQQNSESIIEISTTCAQKRFDETLDYLLELKNKYKAKMIIEVVYDMFTTEKKYQRIKSNRQEIIKRDFDLHEIVKLSRIFVGKEQYLIDKLVDLGIKDVTIDYSFVYDTSLDHILTLEEFHNYWFNFKDIAAKNGVDIVGPILGFQEMIISDRLIHKNSYYVDTDGKLYYMMELPYGDLPLKDPKQNKDFSITNLKEDKNLYIELSKAENQTNLKNKLAAKKHPICSKCEFKDLCNPWMMQELSQYNGEEITREVCFGGKSLFKIYQELRVK